MTAGRSDRRTVGRRIAFLGLLSVSPTVRLSSLQCPDGSPPPCGHRAPVVADSVVTILPFRTVGPELDLWREGLVDLLSMSLDGAGGLHAVAPQRVISHARRLQAQSLDPAVAARVARELGARTYVTGSVVQTGPGRVRLLVESFDAVAARKRAEASFTLDGAESDLASLADSAALVLLMRLSRVPLPTVTTLRRPTPSLPALRAFLDGERAFRAGQSTAADARYAQALQLDSTFALALYRRYQLRYRTQVTTPPTEAEMISQALAVAERLPERERLLLHAVRRGADYLDSTDLAERLDFTRRYPDDPEGYVWVAEWYYHAGAAYGEPMARVLDYGRLALALDSTLWTAYHHPIEVAARLGDSATAHALLARYLRLVEPGDRVARAQELAFHLRFSPPDSARQLVRSFGGESDRVLTRLLSEVLRFDPSMHALVIAEEVARLLARLARSPDAAQGARAALAELLAAQGRFTAAAGTLAEVQRENRGSAQGAVAGSLPVLAGLVPLSGEFGAAVAQLRALDAQVARTGPRSPDDLNAVTILSRLDLQLGDTAAAINRTRTLQAVPAPSEALARLRDLDSTVVSARVALRSGDTATAVRLLTLASRVAVSDRAGYGRGDAFDARLLASLYHAQGARDRARDLVERPERMTILGGGLLGLNRLMAAELAEEAGDTVAARARYRDVVDLWSLGDTAVQGYVARARAGLARLR